MSAPAVSIVIPAYDAAATIGATLASLAAQTRADWEAIVVDDGSRDGTGALVRAAAARDPRIRLIAQPNAGVSAARNAGIAAAIGTHLFFLDADDWIAPDHLDLLLAALADGTADVAYTGYTRVTVDGEALPAAFAPIIVNAPFTIFADHCLVAIHCILFPRALVARTGGFDPGLRICEDWDLWARLARLGTRWRAVASAGAFYRMRPGSASIDYRRMARDGIEVIARCRRPDPRLADLHVADPHVADSPPPPAIPSGELASAHFLLWCAAAAAAAGEDIAGWEAETAAPPGFFADPEAIRWTLTDAIAVGAQIGVGGVARVWEATGPRLLPLLRHLAAGDTPSLRRAIDLFELPLIHADPLTVPFAGLVTFACRIDPARPIAIAPPPETDRLRLLFGDDALELPLWGPLSARDLIALLLERYGLPALAAHSTATTRGRWLRLCATVATRWRRQAGRIERRLLASYPDTAPRPRSPAVRDAIVTAPRGHRPRTPAPLAPPHRIDEESDYERLKRRQTLDLLGDAPIARALEIGCGAGAMTAELAVRAADLTVLDISTTALALAAARAPAAHLRQGDIATAALPDGQDLILCSETLYYLPATTLPIITAKLRDALAVDGRLVSANLLAIDDDPSATGFETDLAFGALTIAAALEATDGLVVERSLRTELYRIDVYRRGVAAAPATIETAPFAMPDPQAQRGIVWGAAVATRKALAATVTTDAVPVLLYHRIADDGPPELAPYRTAPAAFEAQLRLLRRHGFHAIGSAQLDWYRARGAAIPGRPIVISFDDGYRDFRDTAWPILRRHDFTAEVFLATAKVGGAADWDSGFGSPAPLMDWTDVAALAAEGATFGSHLVSHRLPSSLSSAALLDEAARSRAAIEARLGGETIAIAAPFGDIDERIVRVFGEAGYRIGYSNRFGIARHDANPLALPRIDIWGGCTPDAFAGLLGLGA